MQKRCDQNRKRSKRRAIDCPIHGVQLHSVGQKFSLYADRIEHLQQRGVSRRLALITVATQAAVPLTGEWLEAFWCDECQQTQWYHVRKSERNQYNLSVAPTELWQQATGVIHPHGNPSVGEFTQRQSRRVGFIGVKDFKFIG